MHCCCTCEPFQAFLAMFRCILRCFLAWHFKRPVAKACDFKQTESDTRSVKRAPQNSQYA